MEITSVVTEYLYSPGILANIANIRQSHSSIHVLWVFGIHPNVQLDFPLYKKPSEINP